MGDMEALRMGSVLEKEMSCLFPAPLQSLISSEEDLNTLRFCNQNGSQVLLGEEAQLILFLAS